MNRPTPRDSRLASAFTCLASGLAVVALATAFTPASRTARAGTLPLGPVMAGLVGQGGNGSIKGKLVWGGDKAPELPPLQDVGKAAANPEVCAAKTAIPNEKVVVDPKTLGVRDGVAYLNLPKVKNPEMAKALVEATPVMVIDQKNCQFFPHVTAIHQDQKVDFISSDPVNHNVHVTPFSNPGFNQVCPALGKIQGKHFDAEKNAIKVNCDFHGWMESYIKVFDHPFFAVTKDDGTFEIKGVPAGTHMFVIWHPTGYVLKEKARGVTVKVVAGEATDLGEIKIDPSVLKK